MELGSPGALPAGIPCPAGTAPDLKRSRLGATSYTQTPSGLVPYGRGLPRVSPGLSEVDMPTAYQTTACLRRPASWAAPLKAEPRNWCTRCRVHSAEGMLCPVCVDIDRLKG